MIGFVKRFDRPVHPGSEIILVRRSPTPDRGVVIGVPAVIDSKHLIFRVGPEWTSLFLQVPLLFTWRIKFVASTPTTPVRMFRIA